MKIDDALKPIWGGRVTECSFNALNGRLELTVQAEVTFHHIVVDGIVSFLCLQEDGDTFNPNVTTYYLEDIIFDHTRVKTSGDKWLKQFDLRYNIALDLFYSTFMMKAQAVRVDGNTFQIA